MKKLSCILSLLLISNQIATAETMVSSNPINAYAVAIYDETHFENIQALRRTKYDYNGIVYTKIAFFGTLIDSKPEVKIGDSTSDFIESEDIYKNNRKIGELMTYKLYTVTRGHLQVRVENKLYDTKVFVQ